MCIKDLNSRIKAATNQPELAELKGEIIKELLKVEAKQDKINILNDRIYVLKKSIALRDKKIDRYKRGLKC